MIQIQDNISEQKNLKDKLESEQEKLHVEYSKVAITQKSPVFSLGTVKRNTTIVVSVCV